MEPTEEPSPPHKYCLGCGYILDGLPRERCPECGRAFNSADEESYATRLRRGSASLIIALLGGSAFATGMVLAHLHNLGVLKIRGRGALLGILIPTGALCCIFVGAAAYDGLYGRHTAISHRSRLHFAIAIAVAITIWGTVYTTVKLWPILF